MRVVSVALVIEPLHRVDAPGAAWLDVEIHDHVGSQAWFFGHCMDSLTGFGVPDPLLAMSPPPSFQLFGLDHLVVIGMTVAIAAALVFLARRHGEGHVVVRAERQGSGLAPLSILPSEIHGLLFLGSADA